MVILTVLGRHGAEKIKRLFILVLLGKMQCFPNDIVSFFLIIGYDFCLGVGNKFSNLGIGLVDRTECSIVSFYFIRSDPFEVGCSKSV